MFCGTRYRNNRCAGLILIKQEIEMADSDTLGDLDRRNFLIKVTSVVGGPA
jgi:hypothetical protein